MILVAVAAVALAAFIAGVNVQRRRSHYAGQAAMAALTEANANANLRRVETLLASVEAQHEGIAATLRQKAIHELRIERSSLVLEVTRCARATAKWQRAARRPWLPVPPDPPQPEHPSRARPVTHASSDSAPFARLARSRHFRAVTHQDAAR